ncbi:helix-turn-helix domain-containing protein [Geomonas sp. Red69]|uniref:helix-turn-helix domain-containing protein n=1 Tax=Geomonas diazotrophica TaxID=2843197 RepID=UPI001C0F54CE|nr:helix-turn-helix transcriptional regulator [Geomonas diazotrophica]MBU5637985.1 helix-turn-helix domain-containing protein [Geomonas diazotrophica]
MRKVRRNNKDIQAEREVLYAELERGALTLGQATRRMRKMIGLTQAEYATKILKIFPRVLMDIENDRGNPTLETLEKVARPFNLKISFVREKREITEA